MGLKVAIVGRPNVGKSTLFNRLVGQKLALVDDTPGVTRDRRDGEAALGDLRFRVIDTAGLDEADEGSLGARMQEQTTRALADADVALFVVDARDGITPLDRHFAELLRRGAAPVVLVANKAEGRGGGSGAYEAFALGLGEPIAISAEHGDGMAELYAALAPFADQAAAGAGEAAATERPLQLAVIGRPNVGKSTLVNRLLGEERLLTGPEAGITRDAIATRWNWHGRAVRLIDTAGLRRHAKVEEKLEKLSVADTLRAIRFAEVVVLVIDATQMLEKQDLTIAHMVEEEGRALVIAVNKWDLVEDKSAALRQLRDRIATSLAQLHGVALVPISGRTGNGLDALMKAVIGADAVWNKRLPTPVLNRWLAAVQERHPPPLVKGRRLKLRYMTQANIRPPTFALFAATPAALPDSYRRYLVNQLREDFDLPGVPIRIMLRKGENPYAGDK
ncbi:MAG TPA: ribosome biogenesis GTPase Der [Stellaceae bacterium]